MTFWFVLQAHCCVLQQKLKESWIKSSSIEHYFNACDATETQSINFKKILAGRWSDSYYFIINQKVKNILSDRFEKIYIYF